MHNDNAYAPLTQEEFDDRLFKLVDAGNASALLSIPGVYELVAEHFNNDVIQEYENDNAHFRTHEDVVDDFNEEVRPRIAPNDKPALREAWNVFTDRLCKDGQISMWAYENWSGPEED